MGNFIDLTGQKFGKLTVLERGEDYTKPSGAKMVRWICECECGNIKTIRGDALKSGTARSCGCLQKEVTIKNNKKIAQEKDNEILNTIFGDLTPLKRAGDQDGSALYLCKCICGNTVLIKRQDLLSGKKTHCGCKTKRPQQYKDITGQKFGKLIALYPTKQNNRREMQWMFQCDCGNQKEIAGNSVTRGNTLSCGCLKQSHGELIIEQLLLSNDIPFEKEVCLFDYAPNSHARFDFYINNEYLIEFDGKQHYESNNRWWNTEDFVEGQKRKDILKNQWCKENNIPLIRIPYTHIDNLCLEDLILTSSKYIVN